jgi:hypothetical protein
MRLTSPDSKARSLVVPTQLISGAEIAIGVVIDVGMLVGCGLVVAVDVAAASVEAGACVADVPAPGFGAAVAAAGPTVGRAATLVGAWSVAPPKRPSERANSTSACARQHHAVQRTHVVILILIII